MSLFHDVPLNHNSLLLLFEYSSHKPHDFSLLITVGKLYSRHPPFGRSKVSYRAAGGESVIWHP